MSTPTFRSLVCSRARPELVQTGQALSNYFREFSTTQSLAADDATTSHSSSSNDSSRGRGNARQRGRAAASAINTMVKNRGGASPPTGPRPAGAAGAPKVLDVRSLPRGLGRGRGGGGFRGRGGFQGRGDSAASSSEGGANRFAPQTRGGRGGRGGARGRGGMRGGRTQDGEKREREPRGKQPAVDPFEMMDEAETALDAAVRFRQPATYGAPALDVGELLAHAPAAPTTASGRRAAVLASLQAMGGGTGDLVGAVNGYVPGDVEGRVREDGLAFFATRESRAWAEGQIQAKRSEAAAAVEGGEEVKVEETRVFADAGDGVKQAVLRRAVAGEHETPRFAEDVHGIVRAQHLRAGSYGPAATAMFEAKLRSLVGAPKAAVKPAATPAKKAPKAKEAKA